MVREAGVDDKQADALDAGLRDSVATKADLERLDSKMETLSATLEVDILRWLVVTQLALAGFLLTAINFIK